MPEHEKKKTSWADIGVKIVPPIVTGVLIAWAGFVGNMVLSSNSNRQESARLITELQVKREQAECELRKDVFDQAMEAILLKKGDNLGTINDMSKQLLRLELLALNFADSLSLSPLFVELKRDLKRATPVNEEEKLDHDKRKEELCKRLHSLAKRVASSQLSSLAQHGKTKPIQIPQHGHEEKDTEFEEWEYSWPKDNYPKKSNGNKKLIQDSSLIELNGIKWYLELHVRGVDSLNKTAKVQLMIGKEPGSPNPLVNQSFTLDYFNFPMVDNTRLPNNQRFAIVMEAFELREKKPYIYITGIIFPSEYASLRDRPGMQEARKLLESAMEGEKDDKQP